MSPLPIPLQLLCTLGVLWMAVALTAQLTELFAQIDVNGDGTLEWDEWTSFCVEAGIVATRHIAVPIKVKVRVVTLPEPVRRGSVIYVLCW